MSVAKHSILTERQTNLCEYGGVFGVLLTLTCLIQHMIFTINTWLTQLMIPGYLFTIVVFILLALKKPVSLILLIISVVISLTMQLIWTRHQAISLVVICLFIYHIIMLLALHAEHVPARLKEKQRLERAERDEWAGKI